MLCRSFSLRARSSSGCLLALAAVVMCAAGQLPAKAGVVLEIDVTNISAVNFTATGALSAINNSTTTNGDGIAVLNFFVSPYSTAYSWSTFATNTLKPSTASSLPWYTVAQADTSSGPISRDFGICNGPGSTPQVFSTTSAALAGTIVVDFTEGGFDSSLLPSPGASGNVLAGYPGNSGGVIGTWQAVAVPEVIGDGSDFHTSTMRGRKPGASREDTQVDNLCYEGPQAGCEPERHTG